jgi:hypothetical protein
MSPTYYFYGFPKTQDTRFKLRGSWVVDWDVDYPQRDE